MLIEDFILRVRNLDANKIIVEAASLNKEELADLNVLALEKGFLSTGERTPTYENPDYAKYKKAIGSKSSPFIDLKLTGDFHAGFYVKEKSGKIEFGSTDEKESDLQRQYGKDIFGVNTEDFESQIDYDLVNIIDKTLMR